jgi:hypothetical protein
LLVTEKHIKQFAVFYLACFVIIYSWFIYHGLLFSLIEPVFFLNRLDVTHNIFMLTNLQHYLLNSEWLRIGFDTIYLLLPLLLLYTCLKEKKIQTVVAVVMVAFNILYNSFFSTISVVSIENFGAWMFVPLVFLARTPKSFYYTMHICRLLFIIIFLSAGLWKIRAGGVFNIEEMSAILFRQHGSYLAVGNDGWYSSFITYLINHQGLSYALYLFATVSEIAFVVGFFTTRFDKYLIVLFCLFAISDYLVMGINYFTWLPFMGCFYFSKYHLRDS